ncbi:MAG: LacI family DNA-binding transcriptional regulator [Defluviitaleaceae bacterium]|nr:LacI family DNA-binding transcriptional regulator [Defluviitaleaceae bacterium]MCL2275213.1 LacI family DNA-binding transcriptional regulator [Defluviitaleaceae bacterium]
MGISGKELAKMLNLSEAAISMALRSKQGVSTETRKRIIEAAELHGYDFEKPYKKKAAGWHITFVIYKRQGAVVSETPFFSALSEGIETACAEYNFKLQIAYIHKDEDVQRKVDDLAHSDSAGIILLGTEMQLEDFRPFNSLRRRIPLVLLDVNLDFTDYDCVLINNVQGAFEATNFLISRTKNQPGYLRSSYLIGNFEKRAEGFQKSVQMHGMSVSKSVVHKLAPSVEGAFVDMMEILERGDELAPCYFADSDLIAMGAMKAFQRKGLRIPEDIAIIGFDDLPMASYIEPSLTTVHVPKKYIGETAVKRLHEIINDTAQPPVKILVSTKIKKRRSV